MINLSDDRSAHDSWSDEQVLFLSSSSDVRTARLEAETRLGRLLDRVVTERRIRPYEWEACVAEKPFVATYGMQQHLRRPSEPDCVGLIAFFGERIGLPLCDFDPTLISGWAQWSDPDRSVHGPYRALFPWPDDMGEQLRLVADGAFPLTGTVFEVLDALGAGKPVRIVHFADRLVTPADADGRFNDGAWMLEMFSHLPSQREQEDWFLGAYKVQTRGLANFINALNKRSRAVSVHQDLQTALKDVEWFTQTRVARAPLIETNPYRGLDFYDISDSDDLPGRQEEATTALNALKARALPGRPPMIARITGESGCGKTSFLRRGLLGALTQPRERGAFRVAAMRPTDFHDGRGLPDPRVLYRLLTQINRDVPDLNLTASDLDDVGKWGGPRAVSRAVGALTRALTTDDGAPSALVIGLDQFEEIIDDLAAASERPYAGNWRPLLLFVEQALATGRIGIAYTLESSRLEAFERLELPEAFRQAHEVPLGSPSDGFIRAVITQPFRDAGYRLAPKVVDELTANYRAFSRDLKGDTSPLPLLALKLTNLFDVVQGLRSTHVRKPASDTPRLRYEEQEEEISYEEVKEYLPFENEIEELANEASGVRGELSDDEAKGVIRHVVHHFLQSLVTLGGPGFDTITLDTVGDDLFVNLEERVRAFERRRLIVREGGRRRLVHQAVVDKWSLGRRWLAAKRDYLKMEARFRQDARAWEGWDRLPDRLPSDEAAIDSAATVLWNYIQEWNLVAFDPLSSEDASLRDYCLEVFRKSTTPRRVDDRFSELPIAHVHVAAGYDMTELMAEFIKHDPECVHLESGKKRTPLDVAAWASPDTVRRLLKKGAEPVHFDEEGWSTITAAVWQKDHEMFRVLLPHYRTAESMAAPAGQNLLHIAARRGATDIARTLLTATEGLDPMKEDDSGRTPLDAAAMWSQPETFELLLDRCDVRHRSAAGWTALHYAAFSGAVGVIDVLVRLPDFWDLIGATTKDGRTALMIAAQSRHVRAVERLAEEFADPNHRNEESPRTGWTALHYAIAGPDQQKQETRISRHQAFRTVQVLLGLPGIDPNAQTADGKTPIELAKAIPHVHRALIQHPEFDRNHPLSDGSTPLNHLIAARSRSAVEQMLRTVDLDVDMTSEDGKYALDLLIENEMGDLALALLEQRRAHPWQTVEAEDIGLSEAILRGSDELVDAFLDALPDPVEPFHKAQLALGAEAALVSRRREALVARLLRLGASVDARVSKTMGYTLFHIAAMSGQLASFGLMARSLEGPHKRDAWGRTPADLAPDHLRADIEALTEAIETAPFAPAAEADQPKADSPLFALARRGDLAGLEEILKAPHVDPTVKDAWGRTPADVAPDRIRADVERLLQAAAARRPD